MDKNQDRRFIIIKYDRTTRHKVVFIWEVLFSLNMCPSGCLRHHREPVNNQWRGTKVKLM